jgi:putative addiction module component (TIGR02574 family)
MGHTAEILEAALKLDPNDRVDLVEAISASLDGIDLGPEWEEEIRRRLDDVDSGRVKTIPGEEALSRIEQRLRER